MTLVSDHVAHINAIFCEKRFVGQEKHNFPEIVYERRRIPSDDETQLLLLYTVEWNQVY